MCLDVNEELTQELLEGPEEIEVYKELFLWKKQLSSEYYSYIWQPGWNHAADEVDIRTNDHEPSVLKVYGGCFHVYLNPECTMDEDLIRVKFKALKSDLVKAGYFCGMTSATFTKLYLSQEEYDNAMLT